MSNNFVLVLKRALKVLKAPISLIKHKLHGKKQAEVLVWSISEDLVQPIIVPEAAAQVQEQTQEGQRALMKQEEPEPQSAVRNNVPTEEQLRAHIELYKQRRKRLEHPIKRISPRIVVKIIESRPRVRDTSQSKLVTELVSGIIDKVLQKRGAEKEEWTLDEFFSWAQVAMLQLDEYFFWAAVPMLHLNEFFEEENCESPNEEELKGEKEKASLIEKCRSFDTFQPNGKHSFFVIPWPKLQLLG